MSTFLPYSNSAKTLIDNMLYKIYSTLIDNPDSEIFSNNIRISFSIGNVNLNNYLNRNNFYNYHENIYPSHHISLVMTRDMSFDLSTSQGKNAKSVCFDISPEKIIESALDVVNKSSSHYLVTLNTTGGFFKKIYSIHKEFEELKIENFVSQLVEHDLVSQSQFEYYKNLSPNEQKYVVCAIYGIIFNGILKKDQFVSKKPILERIFRNNSPYNYYSFNIKNLNGGHEEINEIISLYNKIIIREFFHGYKKEPQSYPIQKMAYLLNFFPHDSGEEYSLHKMFQDTAKEIGFSDKEMTKIFSKIFSTLNPNFFFRKASDSFALQNYFLTLKNLNKELFYKKLINMFAKKLEDCYRQAANDFVEALLTDEEIQNLKEELEPIFPSFYKESISLSSFIQSENLLSKHYTIDVYNLYKNFPNARNLNEVSSLLKNFFTVFYQTKTIGVFSEITLRYPEHKKVKQMVPSVINFYFLYKEKNSQFFEDSFLLKFLRHFLTLIDKEIIFNDENINACIREFILTQELENNDSKNFISTAKSKI